MIRVALPLRLTEHTLAFEKTAMTKRRAEMLMELGMAT